MDFIDLFILSTVINYAAFILHYLNSNIYLYFNIDEKMERL